MSPSRCILLLKLSGTDRGELVEQRIRTDRKQIARLLADQTRARILHRERVGGALPRGARP